LSTRSKAEIGPLESFYTDFTELRFAGGARKAWLIPLLDHRTKYVAGFAVGKRANSELALTARVPVDRPAALGGRAALLRPSRARRQPRDGELLRSLQGGEPFSAPRRRITGGTQRSRPRSDQVFSIGCAVTPPSETGHPWQSVRNSTARA